MPVSLISDYGMLETVIGKYVHRKTPDEFRQERLRTLLGTTDEDVIQAYQELDREFPGATA